MPGLLPQVRQSSDRPRRFIGDKQFGDLQTPRLLTGPSPGATATTTCWPCARGSASSPKRRRHPARHGVDAAGRRYVDEIGWLGGRKNKHRMRVRRITLELEAGQTLMLITDLLDPDACPATDLLELYRGRRGIEQLFQLVSEVFELRRLIGTTPLAGLFQASFCLLMYNLIQVIKSYAAQDGQVERQQASDAQPVRGRQACVDLLELLRRPGPPCPPHASPSRCAST